MGARSPITCCAGNADIAVSKIFSNTWSSDVPDVSESHPCRSPETSGPSADGLGVCRRTCRHRIPKPSTTFVRNFFRVGVGEIGTILRGGWQKQMGTNIEWKFDIDIFYKTLFLWVLCDAISRHCYYIIRQGRGGVPCFFDLNFSISSVLLADLLLSRPFWPFFSSLN